MTIDDIKQQLMKAREHGKGSEGSVVLWSDTGPSNLALVDALIQLAESQEKRINELERKLSVGTTHYPSRFQTP